MGYISVTELRRHTKDCLDAVAQGKTFYVTRYGKVIARIIPYQEYLSRWK